MTAALEAAAGEVRFPSLVHSLVWLPRSWHFLKGWWESRGWGKEVEKLWIWGIPYSLLVSVSSRIPSPCPLFHRYLCSTQHKPLCIYHLKHHGHLSNFPFGWKACLWQMSDHTLHVAGEVERMIMWHWNPIFNFQEGIKSDTESVVLCPGCLLSHQITHTLIHRCVCLEASDQSHRLKLLVFVSIG